MNEPNKLFERVVVLPLFLLGAWTIGYHAFDWHPKQKYVTAKVVRGDIEDTVSALGTAQPLQFVDVGTQVTGQLKTLHVKIGDEVRKGDLIAEIDPTLFASRANMTRASLRDIRAQLAEKRVLRRLAKLTYERNSALYASRAVSEEILQQSKAALQQAAAQIGALNAQAAMYQAELEGDLANLRYTKVFAPMSGTVVALVAREGQTLVANQQAPIILRIADLNTMTVWAQVSEADVPRTVLHKPVLFSPIGLPNKRWHAEVRQILPTPESVNSVTLYDVLFDVSNQEQLLKPQMSVQISFVIDHAENALLVPVSALHAAGKARAKDGMQARKVSLKAKNGQPGEARDGPEDLVPAGPQKYLVRVLTRGGKVEEREIVAGVMSRTQAQVVSGLEEGEEVVVAAIEEAGHKGNAKPPAGATKS